MTGSPATLPAQAWKRKQYIQELLAQYKQSGLTRRAFALQEGLSVSTLDYWRRRYSLESPPCTPQVETTFVEVGRPRQAGAAIEIVLRNGRALRVPECISRESLLHFIEIVES